MFSIGDQVYYGSTGVCTVVDIAAPDMGDNPRMCYVLKPHYVSNSKVYAPVDNNPVAIRPLISSQQACQLIDSMPELAVFPASKEKQALYDTYRCAIKSADSYMLAKLMKTLHENKQRILEQKKTVPSMEKDLFDTAQRLLHGELASALSIPLENVHNYIQSRLQTSILAS